MLVQISRIDSLVIVTSFSSLSCPALVICQSSKYHLIVQRVFASPAGKEKNEVSQRQTMIFLTFSISVTS